MSTIGTIGSTQGSFMLMYKEVVLNNEWMVSQYKTLKEQLSARSIHPDQLTETVTNQITGVIMGTFSFSSIRG